MIELPLVLKGPRIELRTLEPTFENSKMIYKAVEDSRAHIAEWLPWAELEAYNRPEETFAFLKEKNEGRKNGTAFSFGIFFENEYVGNIDIGNISDRNKHGYIGYWLAKDATGKGIIREAMKFIEKAVFEAGLNKIQIECNSKNVRSANVAQKLGYHLDGELRDDRIMKDGSFSNTIVFSKLKSEWQAENKK